MSLKTGARLGSYDILGPLGKGGMGEVYRARDTRLARDVALKLLPDTIAHDEERVARFRREAQVLAALNHPHIGSIYGLEEGASQRFLVLELVEGETLAARIARGPLPVEEALAIARQVAEALKAAHDTGVVHRDLKPANIGLTPDDQVKVLDFGLAKAEGTASPASVDLTNSPTLASPATLTGIGMILGTAAYMSPEQAKGRPADKRSDVWAFGCVLYEMLTGKRAFEGDDVSEVLAGVLKSTPDFGALPASLPTSVRLLLTGCLEKDPRQRVADVSTALFVLSHPQLDSRATPAASRVGRRSSVLPLLLAFVATAVLAAIGAGLWNRQPASPRPVTRFAFTVPGSRSLSLARRALAVSPDGSSVAYAAEEQLFVRDLAGFESRPIPGGDSALYPVFSPDGQSLVFWTNNGQLKRLAVTGGVPVTVCDGVSVAPFGIGWAGDQVLFVQPGGGILKVPASGGSPIAAIQLDPAQGLAEGPQLLPDGDTVLFTVVRGVQPSSTYWDRGQIVTQSLSTGRRKTIVERGADGRYVPTGHVVYAVEGTLMAVPFDLTKLEVKGAPVPVVEGVRRTAAWSGGEAQFAFSPSGVLVYIAGPARAGKDDLFLFDRKGGSEALNLPAGSYTNPRVSPDGTKVALESTDGKESSVWICDLSRKSSLRRLTFGGNNRFPLWSGDGTRVVFQSDRDGALAIYGQPIDGGPAERLTAPDASAFPVPESWLPRKDILLYCVTKGPDTTLWTLSLRDRKVAPFSDVRSVGAPTDAVFSPDGRWVAYQSGQSGSAEATLFVQPYPPTGARFQVARGGRALWSPDGKELFFVPAPSQFAAVSVGTQPNFSVGNPRLAPRRFGLAPPSSPRPYDMLPDGRLVAVSPADQNNPAAQSEIRVVVNWFDELKAKVPAK
jgi:eukaryotic-like serine/threonine-protein kinase